MFDAQDYFERSVHTLETCEAYAELTGRGVQVLGTWDKWSIITWQETVRFQSGETLEVFEAHELKAGRHYRKVKYHFMNSENRCIFRVDTHGRSVPFESPCHVDIGDYEERLEHGNARLNGISLAGIDFLIVFGLIQKYLGGEVFPWQR